MMSDKTFVPKIVNIKEINAVLDLEEEKMRSTLKDGEMIIRNPLKITLINGIIKNVKGEYNEGIFNYSRFEVIENTENMQSGEFTIYVPTIIREDF